MLRTITGVIDIRSITAAGEDAQPLDLTGIPVSALVPPDDTAYPGVGAADGTFSIAGVPEGNILMKLGSRYLEMSRDSVDLSFEVLGRTGAAFSLATSPTTLSFDVTNLAPWQSTDELEMVSPGSGTIAYAMESGATAGAPSPGETSLTGFSFDLSRADHPQLIDGAAGDTLTLSQLSTQTSANRTFRTVARTFTPAAFSVTNGGSASLTGTFADVAATQTLDAVWDRPAFDAELNARSPRGSDQNWSTLAVSALPEGAARGFYYDAPDVVVFAPGYTTDTTAVTASWAYGDPYPTDWTRIVWVRYFTYRFIQLGSAAPVAISARLIAYRDLATVSAQAPIEPIVGAVVNPEVNSHDAFGPQTGVGTTPTLSWSPPAIGQAARYYVDVLLVSSSAGETTLRQIAALETAATEISIPTGIMQVGQTYVFEIGVRAPANLDLGATPDEYALPDAWSSVTSAMVTP